MIGIRKKFIQFSILVFITEKTWKLALKIPKHKKVPGDYQKKRTPSAKHP